ncbi:MAG TPA: hypothetical protein VGW36_00170 [Pyrinomonadaceae bacterium]|nr:hypothetical protein [Pyrinomonadaceae bacterium]
MSSTKCAQCGLVNFSTDTVCKRCKAPLGNYDVTPQGIVLEDGYVLPPPPVVPGSGVWRDKGGLVMSRDAQLPFKCVKCNAPTKLRLKRKLSWHHPAIYILIFVALLIYLIIALILRKSAVVELGVCEEHLAKRKRNILITWALALLGILSFVGAASFDDMNFVFLAFGLLIAAIIFGLVAVRLVTPSKIDDRYVWLRGVNKEYLAELPQA